ncbi:tubulin epsilon and delta complex protein 1 isoform X3 [Oryctolagus cuniculus]|uniref:tubulin epsilon and delta complex protein 1 isoform X3 n=1 Tax=Oryctolagus cuniculus TaxID=9986 RepID=UPI003879BF55
MGRRRRRLAGAAGVGAGALPEAIAALSQSLPAGPSPEVFRRAKFDRPEAASALWRLLFHVLSPLGAVGASASLGPEARARWVKSALSSQGYQRPALARLPEDGSQGSRELLLALSWLLARGPLLERLLAQTRVRLGDEVPALECESLAWPGPGVEAEGPVDVRRVQWLLGKLRLRWRGLASGQREHSALLSKSNRERVIERGDFPSPAHSWTRPGESRSTGIPTAAMATTASATCLSRKQRRSETQRTAGSCCRRWRGRMRAWRRPCGGGRASWSTGSGWTPSWAPAPRRSPPQPHSPRLCPGSLSTGPASWSWWHGSCRACRRRCGRQRSPGARPGRPGSAARARGRGGASLGGLCRRPCSSNLRPCSGPGSKTLALPGPLGPTGW